MVLDVDGVYLTFELAAIKSVVSKAATPTEPVEDVKIIEVNEDENKETAIETE
ncbi:preprotein translocase subunit YajC [Listeria monocytogenes]|nr:preprotein translocase subunit YajC [Listeria monocytogenes]